jgi:hypothetical protein
MGKVSCIVYGLIKILTTVLRGYSKLKTKQEQINALLLVLKLCFAYGFPLSANSKYMSTILSQ